MLQGGKTGQLVSHQHYDIWKLCPGSQRTDRQTEQHRYEYSSEQASTPTHTDTTARCNSSILFTYACICCCVASGIYWFYVSQKCGLFPCACAEPSNHRSAQITVSNNISICYWFLISTGTKGTACIINGHRCLSEYMCLQTDIFCQTSF